MRADMAVMASVLHRLDGTVTRLAAELRATNGRASLDAVLDQLVSGVEGLAAAMAESGRALEAVAAGQAALAPLPPTPEQAQAIAAGFSGLARLYRDLGMGREATRAEREAASWAARVDPPRQDGPGGA